MFHKGGIFGLGAEESLLTELEKEDTKTERMLVEPGSPETIAQAVRDRLAREQAAIDRQLAPVAKPKKKGPNWLLIGGGAVVTGVILFAIFRKKRS